jgi:hypothetical protein
MLAPRSNASGRQHGCPRRAVHTVLGIHGWVAATSSGSQHRGSLLGCLHDHGPVAALPSIQCLRPWSSGGVEKNGGEEGCVGVLNWPAAADLKRHDGIGCRRGGPSASIALDAGCQCQGIERRDGAAQQTARRHAQPLTSIAIAR